MLMDNRTNVGRAGMALAIAYYGSNGYTVNIPLNDTQWYDLILEKEGQFYTVQCKATATENDTIDLRSKGGTKGETYDHVLDHETDYLFCLSKEGNMYSIPVEDIRKYGTKKVFV